MPFTTPPLSGTRLREVKQSDLELLVPNPSGGRGVYILQWAGVRALCNPTVHDTMLFRRSCALTMIEPASVRDVALEVAVEGHAGREAAAAAKAAIAHADAQRLLAHFSLVTALVAQVDPTSPQTMSMAEPTADLDRRASASLHRIAPAFGRPAAQLAASLTAVGNLFAPIGVTSACREARIPRLLARLEETHSDLFDWVGATPDNDIGGLGTAIARALQVECGIAAAALENARSALADPIGLLKRWIGDADSIKAMTARCDWLLDGWERVSLLWLLADTRALRRAALLEMALLVPVLPPEVMEWTDLSIPPEAMKQTCRVTSYRDAWRTGNLAFALIERNEKLLAMST